MLRLKTACVVVVLVCGTAPATHNKDSRRTQAVQRTVHVTPPRQGESRYYYFPFAVPPHAQRITIKYEYDKADGANVLDIGLFDSRADAQHSTLNGFRGWSGGRRTEFFITRDAATPGYASGEIQEGTWHVILGLYRVAPGGVDVTFNIENETNENETTTVTTSTKPRQTISAIEAASLKQMASRDTGKEKTSRRWLVGDLHMHTVHSDGDWSVEEVLNSARSAGLDFVSITDHNTNSHHAEIDQANKKQKALLVIRGEEITTYGGHANAWGLPGGALIDFRITPGDQFAFDKAVRAVHAAGALISINHPFALCSGCNWSYEKSARNFDAIEVWNGSWDVSDGQAVKMWDQLLQNGRQITAIASSDSHRPLQPLGMPSTHVQIDGRASQGKILRAIKEGRTYLTATPTPTVKFEGRLKGGRDLFQIGDTVHASTSELQFTVSVAGLKQSATVNVISAGQIVRSFQADTDTQQNFTVDALGKSYFRIEVRAKGGEMLTLTNPIYVEITRSQNRNR